ncbi:LppU/SCO3897 family protein [Actinomadura alba]|uniref:Septum formation-related domain-containing protein n=1 Tax=Actinomadura alba TaxID=406431 RepID=A0ABR7LPV7_9ACTN|nr:hypothetical protein [Actinomadura alba]MBC6466851.1 hypothetical protein [Actinomadura alba]
MAQQPPAHQPQAAPFQHQPGYQPPHPQYPGPPQAGRRSGRLRGILIVVAVLGLGGIGSYAWDVMTGDPDTAEVGDCLIDDRHPEDVKIVKCDDPKAAFKVEGKVEDVAERTFDADADNTVCKDHPAAETSFWSGFRGRYGTVLCLSKVK